MVRKPRVHEIAAELQIDSKDVMAMLKSMGEFVKGPSSSLQPPVARKVTAALQADRSMTTGIFWQRFGRAYQRLVAALPASLPQLCGQLVSELERGSAERSAFLAQALRERSFYYCDTATGRRAAGGARAGAALELDELPSPSGVLAISGAGSDLTIVAWTGPELRVAGFVLEGEPTPRLARFHLASSTDDSLIQLLARAIDLIPVVTRESSTGARPRAGASRPGAAGTDVKVVYAGRASSEARGDASSKRMSNWLVRGHWRNQWYSSVGEHRRIWVSEHSAGASEGVQLSHDLVHVIRPASDG